MTVSVLSGCNTLTDNPVVDASSDDETITSLENDLAALKTDYENLEQQLSDLEGDYKRLLEDSQAMRLEIDELSQASRDLANKITLIEIDFGNIDLTDINSKIDDLSSIDLTVIQELEDDLTSLNGQITSIENSINAIQNFDLQSIETMNESIDLITNSIDSISAFIAQLSVSDDPDTIELTDELEAILNEINSKLSFLRSYDIRDYNLTDDKVHDLMYKLEDAYSASMPGDELQPKNSSYSNKCTTITYEICQKSSGAPSLYTKHYDEL